MLLIVTIFITTYYLIRHHYCWLVMHFIQPQKLRGILWSFRAVASLWRHAGSVYFYGYLLGLAVICPDISTLKKCVEITLKNPHKTKPRNCRHYLHACMCHVDVHACVCTRCVVVEWDDSECYRPDHCVITRVFLHSLSKSTQSRINVWSLAYFTQSFEIHPDSDFLQTPICFDN